MSDQLLQTSRKIGDLAKQTGLSIRTLHYYDEIGLLKPSQHTEAGHRLYTEKDIIRLQQIVSLRQLGFSLEEIKNCLEKPNFEPIAVMRSQIAKLHQQIELQQRLAKLLESIVTRLQVAEAVSVNDLIQAIEVSTMTEDLFNKYYTPEQRQYLDHRKEMLGNDAISQAQKDWQELFAAVQAEMNKGTDPSDEKVLALAKRWGELLESFTGGNPGIMQSLNNLVQAEYPTMQQQFAFPNPQLFEYIGKAQAALKK
jgi:MerR family transcriptional regulator, thiopeptide resistance regulator